ncbi:MAG: NUDIX domain-containing protein [Candidatus Aenigmarchaeota archaeon]|nr:NUDIX domain-containing protein [Candidatus Aenigmarchaeota archaeon]
MRSERSAGFVVFRKDTRGLVYLLLQNSSKFFWDFPKGHISPGEGEEAAARRELMEEAGITQITPVSGFREQVSYSYTFRDEVIQKDLIMFAGEVPDERVVLSWEHSSFAWLTFDDARERLKDKKLAVLEKAHGFLSENLGL